MVPFTAKAAGVRGIRGSTRNWTVISHVFGGQADVFDGRYGTIRLNLYF